MRCMIKNLPTMLRTPVTLKHYPKNANITRTLHYIILPEKCVTYIVHSFFRIHTSQFSIKPLTIINAYSNSGPKNKAQTQLVMRPFRFSTSSATRRQTCKKFTHTLPGPGGIKSSPATNWKPQITGRLLICRIRRMNL